jgi:hypothetical protein
MEPVVDLMEKVWNRWHTDGWVLTVVRDADGGFTYSVIHNEQPLAAGVSSPGLAQAQHSAEDIVRNSSHRCLGPCSYWVADPPDE